MIGKKFKVSWNCQGTRSREFLQSMMKMSAIHRPTVVIPLEPRISGTSADEMCMKVGKKNCIQSEAVGFSDEIWI